MENDTSTAAVTAEPVETQQPQPAQPETAVAGRTALGRYKGRSR